MIDELQKRFAIPGIQLVSGNGGLTKAIITAGGGSAEIYLHGAHVTHFQPAGQKPVLYLSSASLFQPGKAIRGGVPICWPWFGPHPTDSKLPMHGFARTSEWQVESAKKLDEQRTVMTLRLEPNDTTRLFWPHEFVLRYTVTVGAALELELEFTNRDTKGAAISEALHSYLSVGDVEQISLNGLKGLNYFDKVKSERAVEDRDAIRLAGETDRVYLDTPSAVTIDDASMKRKINVEKIGSNSTVVWNPFEAKAAGMADLGKGEWHNYVCIEAANALENIVTVEPGETHRTGTTLRVM